MSTAASERLDASTAYRLNIGELCARPATDEHPGLSEAEARSRLTHYAPNELAAEKRVPPWRRFLSQFQEVLVILLVVATGVSAALWAFERDAALPYEAIAIFAVVLLNATLGFLHESRTEAAVMALRAMFAADASVIRGRERQRVPASELVLGDVIIIEEGDTIPADGRLIESASLQVSEAALTGESTPVSKDTASIADEVPLGDRYNMVFSGWRPTRSRYATRRAARPLSHPSGRCPMRSPPTRSTTGCAVNVASGSGRPVAWFRWDSPAAQHT